MNTCTCESPNFLDTTDGHKLCTCCRKFSKHAGPVNLAPVLLEGNAQGAGSKGERALETELQQIAAKPFVREYRFHPQRKWRFDFAWPLLKIAIEVDGGNRITGRTRKGQPVAVGRHGGWEDMVKLNTAALMGWRVFRTDPRHTAELAAWIEDNLRELKQEK